MSSPLSDTRAAPEISVIVVNYGTAELARAAVDSVLAHEHGGRHVDIHLVDNASPGDDRQVLQAAMNQPGWAERVTFYPETENHGFGRGNNLVLDALAAREIPPAKVFLLNPDARLDNEAIAILADVMERHPEVGFAGAGISQPDTGPVVAAFRFPGPLSEVCTTLGLGFVFRLFRNWQTALPHDHPEGPVDWLAGAALMIRFDTLRDAGAFDPGFFLYFEEVELMRRAGRKGWQSWYVPRARAVHSEGAATGVKSDTGGPPHRPAYWYRSWALYFRLSYGRARAVAIALIVLLSACINNVLSFLRGRRNGLPRNFLRDFCSQVLIPLLSGSEGKS